MRSFEAVLVLVALATVVAVSARRLRLPAPSLLVVAGVVVGLLPGVPAVQVSPEIVSLVVLPPLLYAAGEDLSWRELRAVWRPVAVLAIGLVLASAAAVGAIAVAVTPLSGSMAFVLGAVLASTDPVAVTALGRRLPLPARVQTLIQAESLFNDATSLVLVRVAVAAAVAGGAVSWAWGAGQFALLAGGGVAVGAVVAAGVALIRRRTEDPILETVIALVTPYAAYVAAEALHVSGVTAVVVASVILGGLAPHLTNAGIRLQLHAVYGTVVFLLESVVFSLIGLALPALLDDLNGSLGDLPWQVLAIAATLLAVRALWVFPLSLVMRPRSRPPWAAPAVVSWAGARGVLPLAAALSIPLTTDDGAPLAHRGLVLTITTAVIVLTLTVQGFSLGPLVRRAGIAVTPQRARDEDATARLHMARAARDRLDELDDLQAVPDAVSRRLRRSLNARVEQVHPSGEAEDSIEPTYRKVRRELIAVESRELHRLHETALITETTRRRLQRTLDLEDASLADNPGD
ncbi:Na+/H+ antiporter [Phytohabitans rumicis]|uniref:Na+/H+ antiporter n=1 Tax=Phytohabitans rumicis TaxID=1076125 RepID=A0A6V8LKF3_9ACTN|nr:Na+/H+ antiporter [Phytohabitans rumicis]GFJ95421.1 Na+/H+ antiporter [Phytohabitans rumicis]